MFGVCTIHAVRCGLRTAFTQGRPVHLLESTRDLVELGRQRHRVVIVCDGGPVGECGTVELPSGDTLMSKS